MSSTFVIGKSAAACVDEHGKVFYLLQEKCYESNVWPRRPKWSVTFFGPYEECMARVIWGCGSVEGGSLKGDARTPSAFIKQWREQLAAPVRLAKQVISVEFGTTLYKLPEQHKQAVSDLLQSRGFPAIEGSRLTIDMNADGALQLLADLSDGRFDGFYAWRLFGDVKPIPEYASPAPEFGTPVPEPAKVQLDVSVYTLGSEREGWDEQLLITGPKGSRLTGWPYSTVDSFISNEALGIERLQSGSAEPAIAAFRKLLRARTFLPSGTRIVVKRPPKDDDAWQSEKFAELCAAAQKLESDVVVLSPGDVVGGVLRLITNLGNSFVTFEVPGLGTETVEQQLELAA